MTLLALGYLGVSASDQKEWTGFAEKFVGMEAVPYDAGIAFRIDERAQRLFVEQNGQGPAHIFGWETADSASLAAMKARLDGAGVAVTEEPRELAERRRVRELISCEDPVGNRLEIFYGAELGSHRFRPGRGVSGFRTSPGGLGHVALTVDNFADMLTFYRDLLGFRSTDYMLDPFEAHFLHLNARHHSIGLINTGRNGVHHLMLEYLSLDDVGHAYDLVLDQGRPLATTLGRHTNDLMTSFYVETPADFLVELGWGGREIDPGDWIPHEVTTGPSIWGHDRRWLPEPARARAREMRIKGAELGRFEPVQVIDGNFSRKSGSCGWPGTN